MTIQNRPIHFSDSGDGLGVSIWQHGFDMRLRKLVLICRAMGISIFKLRYRTARYRPELF